MRAIDTAKDMEEKFTPRKGEKIHLMSGSSGARGGERPRGRSPGKARPGSKDTTKCEWARGQGKSEK